VYIAIATFLFVGKIAVRSVFNGFKHPSLPSEVRLPEREIKEKSGKSFYWKKAMMGSCGHEPGRWVDIYVVGAYCNTPLQGRSRQEKNGS